MNDDDIEYVQLANPNPGGQQVGCYVPPIVAFQRSTGIAVFVDEPERSQFKMKAKAHDQLVALLGVVEAARGIIEHITARGPHEVRALVQLERALDSLSPDAAGGEL